MSSNKYYIGIDPDVNESGFAVWNTKSKCFDEISKFYFWDLIDRINRCDKTLVTFILDKTFTYKKSNWHDAKTVGISTLIGRKVGRNNQVAHLLVDYFDRHGYSYSIVNPAGKKISDNVKLFKQLSKYKGRTNKDMREAAVLVLGK